MARIPELIVGDRNARGIPSAIFVVRRALFPCHSHWQARSLAHQGDGLVGIVGER